MRRNLSGRKLVITGAARGIGEKVARLAAARGAHVALIGLEPDRLRALADELGPTASWREADVRDGIALRSAIDNCAMTMGGIDIVVANAGVAAYGTVRQADEASFERVLDINLNGENRRDVDGTRIAVWGSSFGGGHSITVASRHPELKAAVAQCPFTDGLASALALGRTESLKVLPSVAKDFASKVLRRPPAMIPLAGPPGSLALMNAPDALPGYEALLPPETTFRNEVAARVAPTIATYRPGRAAKKIKFPILFCVSEASPSKHWYATRSSFSLASYSRSELSFDVRSNRHPWADACRLRIGLIDIAFLIGIYHSVCATLTMFAIPAAE